MSAPYYNINTALPAWAKLVHENGRYVMRLQAGRQPRVIMPQVTAPQSADRSVQASALVRSTIVPFSNFSGGLLHRFRGLVRDGLSQRTTVVWQSAQTLVVDAGWFQERSDEYRQVSFVEAIPHDRPFDFLDSQWAVLGLAGEASLTALELRNLQSVVYTRSVSATTHANMTLRLAKFFFLQRGEFPFSDYSEAASTVAVRIVKGDQVNVSARSVISALVAQSGETRATYAGIRVVFRRDDGIESAFTVAATDLSPQAPGQISDVALENAIDFVADGNYTQATLYVFARDYFRRDSVADFSHRGLDWRVLSAGNLGT